jgi:hypothetical protein
MPSSGPRSDSISNQVRLVPRLLIILQPIRLTHTFSFGSPEVFLDSSYVAAVDAESSLPSAGIEPIPSASHEKCLFKRRQRYNGWQLSCYYLLQTLRSYPEMMLYDALPPFIHEQCTAFDSTRSVGSMDTKHLFRLADNRNGVTSIRYGG